MKICSTCHKEQDISEYHRDKFCSDGLRKQCKNCRNAKVREWRIKNPGVTAGYMKKYRLTHPEKVKESDKIQNKKNRVRKTENARLWRRRNPDKLRESNKRHYQKQREWAKNHPEVLSYFSRVRRGMCKQAQPSWVDKEHLDKIREFYISARTRSEFHEIPFHVDHMEPLKGINENKEHVSCGLHVWWNLQVLEAVENLRKSNKLNSIEL